MSWMLSQKGLLRVTIIVQKSATSQNDHKRRIEAATGALDIRLFIRLFKIRLNSPNTECDKHLCWTLIRERLWQSWWWKRYKDDNDDDDSADDFHNMARSTVSVTIERYISVVHPRHWVSSLLSSLSLLSMSPLLWFLSLFS